MNNQRMGLFPFISTFLGLNGEKRPMKPRTYKRERTNGKRLGGINKSELDILRSLSGRPRKAYRREIQVKYGLKASTEVVHARSNKKVRVKQCSVLPTNRFGVELPKKLLPLFKKAQRGAQYGI
jgi:hypothetical protein